MRNLKLIFAYAFGGVALADLFFIYRGMETWRLVSKPLLLPLLMLVYFLNVGLGKGFPRLMMAALFFSWAGDVLLIWDQYFMPGLLAFLTAHIFYILYFVKVAPGEKGFIRQQPLFAVPVLVYWGLFLALLFPYLDKLRLPVAVYATVICTMLLCSFNLWGMMRRWPFLLFVNGAVQFVISDSLLAIHKFVYPFWFLPLVIMLTYCSAQYLLVRGSIRHLKDS